MPEYRRNRVPGGTDFFTLALADRRTDLLVCEIAALGAAILRTQQLHPFQINAWVVLPEHLHAVWTLPEGNADYSRRWTLIKRWFSATIPPTESRSASRAAKGERGIWQRRFWEHTIRDANDFVRHRLCPFQSGQTRPCRASNRLATFVVPTSRRAGVLCGRMGAGGR